MIDWWGFTSDRLLGTGQVCHGSGSKKGGLRHGSKKGGLYCGTYLSVMWVPPRGYKLCPGENGGHSSLHKGVHNRVSHLEGNAYTQYVKIMQHHCGLVVSIVRRTVASMRYGDIAKLKWNWQMNQWLPKVLWGIYVGKLAMNIPLIFQS